jgi:uncharacterized metal-binding protein YceD (DUF177 family)
MTASAPEFSRILSADRLPIAGTEELLEAKPAEREALAKRFDLVDLSYLRAQLVVTPARDQTITVKGAINAEVTQSCVVTLEPVSTPIQIDIDMMFVPAAQKSDGAGTPFAEDDDQIEVYSGTKIDLGEMVAQHLGVSLDPYPRKPGAALRATEFGPKVDVKPNPFKQLAGLVEVTKK